MRRPRRLPLPWALVAAYGVLGLAWAITNAPFSAPDESQHYIRAIGISRGHLIGAHTVYNGPVLSPKETAWRHHLTRAVSVPAGLSPDGLDCELFHPNVTPACGTHVTPNPTTVTEQTDVGVYQPAPYLLPAVAVHLSDRAAGADRAGRIAMLLLWLALLSAAAWMLWDRAIGALSLTGLVIAVTPMVVFMGSSLSDSSLETMASIAFLASLLRFTRQTREASGAALIGAGVFGAVLALSRSLGPLWVVCDALLCGLLVGGRVPLAFARRYARAAAFAVGLLACGVILNVLWVGAYGPHVTVTAIPGVSVLHDGLSQLRSAWDGVIGRFGYEDVPLGWVGVLAWTLLAVALVATAMWRAAARERGVLLAALALAFALPIYIYAAATSNEGIQTQGRHILPLLITVPLLSGEILRRRVADLRPSVARLLFPTACIVAAAIQLLAWWENSRRYAVGLHGSWWFLGQAQWTPPGGWVVWAALVAATAAAVVIGSSRQIVSRLAPGRQ